MKMRNYYILFAALGMMLLFSGCEDFLDKRDPTATSFDEFYNDEEDLRRVVYSSYLDVYASGSNRRTLFYMEDGKSDNAYSRTDGDHHQRIANGNFDSSTEGFLYHYELAMKHLGRLNVFIANSHLPYVEDEAIRERYKGVLEALRVWHYFKLTTRWGDVPFLLEPADLETAIQPATPQKELLDKLFPLAEEIAARLPLEEYQSNKYMFNRNSLKALTMRYALIHGRYELAARLAKEIMDSGKYQLHHSYFDLFQYGYVGNKEFIMHQDKDCSGTRYSFRDLGPHFRTGAGESQLVPLKDLVDSYWTLQGNPIDKCPLHSAEEYELNPRLNRDPRYAASIMGHGDEFYGEIIDIYDENSPMFHEKTRASRSGYWFRKFVCDQDAFASGGVTQIEYGMLRYAEVLLTYAEAKIMLNDVDALAKDCINQVRRRAGLDMTEADVTLPKFASYTQAQWIDLIRRERRIEFAGEGLRYDDILRWKIAQDVLNKPAMGHTRIVNGQKVSLKIEDRSFQPHNYLWPFHENTMRVEPGLTQNPGY
ncbi:RagB/SusD family nutrient uptake outer membrane protein [Parabacteroides pacaensis]|uniref:RagB/SusD family nutrient uptake outer membrane protein n=1 Tax=Parabacteroides pacaensis TaxID=2086575 RepID=UPI0018FE7C88|nr:RagB/SusD family nutrient uptake outer membrane protein [Parabacteroides pacaensis]